MRPIASLISAPPAAVATGARRARARQPLLMGPLHASAHHGAPRVSPQAGSGVDTGDLLADFQEIATSLQEGLDSYDRLQFQVRGL